MKIRDVRPVLIDLLHSQKASGGERSWHQYLPRGLPINKFDEFPATALERTPGFDVQPVWVQISSEDGTFGLGRCSFGSAVADLIQEEFAPLLVGRDVFATELLNGILWEASRRHGAQGLSSVAISGIDLALWDLKGKLLDRPVYSLLGGPSRRRIPCYATTNDVEWALELGFKAIKLPNSVHWTHGLDGLHRIEQQAAAARDKVGPRIDLMLNPVMCFDVEYAVRVAEILRRYNFRWMEEPLVPEDIRGLAALKRAVPWMGIATGEDHRTRYPFVEMLTQQAVDIVQPDLEWCGGVSEAVKINTLAEAHGIKTMPHASMNTPFGQHFVAALPNCPLGEFHIGSGAGVPLETAERIPGLVVPKDGYVEVSDAPGFGIEVTPTSIRDWTSQKRR